MATYYWVGGTGNWDATTTHWSNASGGAGGFGPPTSADDVIFDSLSNATAYTVTLLTAPVCRSVTVAGPASGNVTLAGTAAWSIYGSMTLAATGITRTYTGAVTFAATTTGWTITTNGQTLGSNFTFNGVGGGWTLGSAYSNTNTTLQLTAGSFDTGGYSLTTGTIQTSGSATRSLTLGASTITLSASWNILTTTGLTFSVGTSTINLNGSSGGFTGAGLTYNNVGITYGAGPLISVGGANTFANFSITGRSGLAIGYVSLSSNQIITGTFTVAAPTSLGASRMLIQSATYGTARTITAAAVSLTDADFQDITGAGAATWTGTRLGNAGGNSNITFDTPKTVYWNLSGTQQWVANGWATTSTGTPARTNYPLAQDTAIFTDNLPAAGATININSNYICLPTVDCTARTAGLTFSITATQIYAFGSFTLSSAMTLSGGGALAWMNRSGIATITSAGKAWTQTVSIQPIGATVQLGDAFSSSGPMSVSNGTFDTQSYNVTCSTFSTSNSNTRTLSLGSSTWTITGSGTTAWNASVSTGLTLNPGSSTISMTSATAKTFAGGTKTYWNLNQGGAGALTISGSNTFNNLTNSVQPTTVTFTSSTTQTFANFNLNGIAGNLVTINASTAGTRANLVKTGGNVSCDYLNIKDLAAA